LRRISENKADLRKKAVALNIQAKEAFDSGDYATALAYCNSAVTVAPGETEVFENRGNTYLSKPNPDYDKAIADFNEAITLDINNIQAYIGLSSAYTGRGNTEKKDYLEAKNGMEFLIRKSKSSPPDKEFNERFAELKHEIYYTLANNYLKQQNYGGAVDNLTSAIQAKPDYGDAYLKRGIAYININDLAKARLDIDQAHGYDHDANLESTARQLLQAATEKNSPVKINNKKKNNAPLPRAQIPSTI
jgi:tetratricopeptide (TPR) repeat protein